MADEALAERVNEALSIDGETFQRRVEEDAQVVRDALDDGVFDNPTRTVGLEYEFYAVEEDSGTLGRTPRELLDVTGFEKELGLHNAESSTSPQPLNDEGLTAQAADVVARLREAQDVAASAGVRLVSDGMWTIPPAGSTTWEYLTSSVEKRGIQLAENMSESARYHAMANTTRGAEAEMRIDAPNVTLDADTVLPESLITSIQPHLQLRRADSLPERFRYALRIAGPLLALGANSPFFPPDLYDDVSPGTILEDAWMEHRICVFETVLNAPDADEGKVRFPRDVDTVEESVQRVVDDETIVPLDVERGTRFDDEFAHFTLKHGTYWRWVRPVFDGASESAANVRIEFRPLPAQPTVGDSIAFQRAFAGAVIGLASADHPVASLPWERARENFYAAAKDGLDASLTWITADGAETTDVATIYEDLLAHAAAGLAACDVSQATIDRSLAPLRHRARTGRTPARWKHALVSRLVEAGASFPEAVTTMQRRYLEYQRETLLDGSFVDWPVEANVDRARASGDR